MRLFPLPAPSREGKGQAGFSLIELVIAMAIMTIVMTSLAYVIVNSAVDAAYNRQRSEAISLANQAVEEVRALPWATVLQGMSTSDPYFSSDSNIYSSGGASPVYCFEDQPLDVGGTIGAQSSCQPLAWSDPSCLSGAASGLPSVSSLSPPAPLVPHAACYSVGGRVYGVEVYLTGASGSTAAPLTLTVVVSWARPVRGGLADHVVTTTELSSCQQVGATCA